MIHNALRSMCTGNEKESNAAYGFCQEFARQHPLLVMPHLVTLRLLLKELLPLLRQGELQSRQSVIRAFFIGIGLLDALRPHVILNSNAKYKTLETSSSQRRWVSHRSEGRVSQSKNSDCKYSKTNLESILDLYFQILGNLDVQDRSHLAKVVARFSDFLCHCVVAGGRSREYVAAHRVPILETTAQIFSKLKKIVFLLSLLDKPEVSRSEEMPSSGALIRQPWNNVSYPQPTSSSIARDDILKVRTQLQQCIELFAGEQRKQQGLSIYNKEKPIQFFRMGVNDLEEGNLVATLNDLERASARMPAILSVFEDSLVQLTMVKDSSIRERIYTLLERSLLHCPSNRSASNIVQGLLQELRSTDVARAKSAARNASRFFHFSPEFQESILVEMLQLGIVASEELQQLLQGLISVASFPSVIY